MTMNHLSSLLVVLALVAVMMTRTTTTAFQPLVTTITTTPKTSSPASTSRLFSAPPKENQEKKKKPKRKPRYEPKWVKKATLADQAGGVVDFTDKGIKGNVAVVFQTRGSNETKTTMALAGQPLRDVATQAGQFIKYGCGKGECGTCECMVNNQWIRPCTAVVPSMPAGEEYVVQTKAVKNKGLSSGKFYSIRSLIMGFWNNLLGMWGFVKYRRNAKRNWQERQDYENLIKQRTAEIRQERLAREAAEAVAQGLKADANASKNNGKPLPPNIDMLRA